MSLFPKRLNQDFSQNFVSFSLKKTYTKMSNNILNGKKGFLNYKNVILTKWDNVHFA